MTITYTAKEISEENFVTNYMIANPNPKGTINVELKDGPFNMPVRIGLINIILWKIYFKHGIMPSSTDYIKLHHIDSNTFSKIHTKIYYQFINQIKLDTINMTIKDKFKYEKNLTDSLIDAFWISINEIYAFVDENCITNMSSLSILSLSRMTQQPEIKQLQDKHLDSKLGTEVCELQLKETSNKLLTLLNDPNALPINPLLDFMEVSMLNNNQIPQLLLAYGPRSDIDDTMMKYVVNASTIGGIQNVFDYGIESLGAKKASHSNKVVIKSSQYFYRRLRLVCSSQIKLYAGDCGSKITVPYFLKAKHMKNFYDKVIIVDNKPIVLSPENIDQYLDTEVQLKSPFGCNHKDGCCVACSGRGNMDTGYFTNHNHHIGISSASKVGSSVSQMVLSAKHLIKTNTKSYTLPDTAKRYLCVNVDRLAWNPVVWEKLKGAKMVIPIKAMGPLEDLSYIINLPVRETYSAVKEFDLVDVNNKVINRITLTDGTFIPCFTKQALTHIAKNITNVETTENTITIPLDGFNPKKDFFKYIVVNDDMIAFTESIDKFLKSHINTYTSVAQALKDFTAVLYSKTSVNIYFVEIVLKSFLITNSMDYRMPSIEDVDNVTFGSMSNILTHRDLSSKLAFEQLVRYFKSASTYQKPKNPGIFDQMFNI